MEPHAFDTIPSKPLEYTEIINKLYQAKRASCDTPKQLDKKINYIIDRLMELISKESNIDVKQCYKDAERQYNVSSRPLSF
ncbi:MAG: hypothetical protein Q3M30_09015 [Candidatus Electrothrix sp. Rat3]|nr:hypothetical protein [Candidatus Electrothrix rattekaaiensis]